MDYKNAHLKQKELFFFEAELALTQRTWRRTAPCLFCSRVNTSLGKSLIPEERMHRISGWWVKSKLIQLRFYYILATLTVTFEVDLNLLITSKASNRCKFWIFHNLVDSLPEVPKRPQISVFCFTTSVWWLLISAFISLLRWLGNCVNFPDWLIKKNNQQISQRSTALWNFWPLVCEIWACS